MAHEVACRCPTCDRKWAEVYQKVSDNGLKRVDMLRDKLGADGRPWKFLGIHKGVSPKFGRRKARDV